VGNVDLQKNCQATHFGVAFVLRECRFLSLFITPQSGERQ